MTNISIIIPSRNRYTFLIELLQDLDNQSLRADEIIVVDQSDQPYRRLPCVHIVDNGIGPCRARNLGLEKASGEIFIFLDDDVRVDTGFLETITLPIRQNRYQVVVGAICNIQGEYRYLTNIHWRNSNDNWLLALTANPDYPGCCQTFSFPAGCAAIHRSVYETIGAFDPFFDPNGAGEDREYGLRIIHAGYSILYNGEAFVKHLGAPSGGRRENPTGFRYQNILHANSVYIAAKYLSWPLFDDFCANWLRSILNRYKGINPRIWARQIRWRREAAQFVGRIRQLKINNDW